MKERIETIDSLKLIAIFFVIGIHSVPFYLMEGDTRTLAIVINQICRFAVPAFFVVSGYLYASNFDYGSPVHRYARTSKRIIILYVFWCLFYLLPYNFTLIFEKGLFGPFGFAKWSYNLWTLNWEKFFLEGSKAHLWFLPALWFAVTISTPFIALRKMRLLLLVAIILYIYALLCGPYRETAIGFVSPISPRNGPFFSVIFFAAGVALSNYKSQDGILRWAYGLFFIGLFWQVFEALWLSENYESKYIYDFNSGTLAYGLGAAMLGIYGAKPLRNAWLERNGQYSLGIYLFHMVVLDLFIPLSGIWNNSVVWESIKVLIFFLLTLWIVKYLVKYPVFKFVMK